MPLILLAVGPDYLAEALHEIVLEVALVDRAVRPGELALALLEPFEVHPAQQTAYPSQQDPSVHFQIPNPCWISSTHSPVQLEPSLLVQTPLPCALSSFHSPSQTSPLLWISLPRPLALSSSQQPSQRVQSSQTCLPLPFLRPLLNWPMYLMPSPMWTGSLLTKTACQSQSYLKGPRRVAMALVCQLQKDLGSRLQSSWGSRVMVVLASFSAVEQASHWLPMDVKVQIITLFSDIHNTTQLHCLAVQSIVSIVSRQFAKKLGGC